MPQLLKQSGPYLFGGVLITFLMLFDLRLVVSYSDTHILYGISVAFSLLAFALTMHSFHGFKTAFDAKLKLMHCCAIAAFTVFFSYYALKAYGVIQPVKPTFTEKYISWVLEILFIFVTPVLTLIMVVAGELTMFFKNNKPIEKNPYGNASLLSSMEAEHKSTKHGLPLGRILKGLEGNETNLIERIKSASPGSIFRYNPVHSFLIAPTGAGKGVGFVIPALLDYDGPVVCVDPKGAENYKITAKHRSKTDKKIYAFDTNQLTGQKSDCFNVFDFLDPEDRSFQDTLKSYIASICPTVEDSRENYFIEAAQDIILCAFLICFQMAKEDQNLLSVYSILMKPSDEFEGLLEGFAEDDSFDGMLARNANKILSTDSRELSGCLNTARRHLKFVDSTYYRDILTKTTIKFDDIITNKADLFFCIPTKEIKSYASGFIRLVLTVFIDHCKKQSSRPAKDIYILLDEMAGIGRLDMVEDILLEGRAFGLKIIGIAQTIASLKKVYYREIDTILSSSLTMFMGLTTPNDLDYVSKKLGSKTVFTESDSKSEKQDSESHTTSAIRRELLTADELQGLYDQYMIAFAGGMSPLILKKLRYYDDREYKKRL